LACAERCAPGARQVYSFAETRYTPCANIHAWALRLLLTGLCRLIASARPLATPEAAALLDSWASVVDSVALSRLRRRHPSAESAARALATDVEGVLEEADWEAIAASAGRTRTQRMLFTGDVSDYCALFSRDEPVPLRGPALLRLGWCAVATSTGLFAMELGDGGKGGRDATTLRLQG
jgi:hypothetical protein